MWFFLGLITTLGFVIGSLLWRLKVSWKGEIIEADGIKFEFRIIRNKYLSDELYIGVEGIDGIRFRFKAETWYDKLFKFLGVSKEYQTNHAEFDDKVYIASDNSNLHSLITNNPDLAASILGVFEHPVTPGIKVREIRNYAGKIWVQYKIPTEFTDVGILTFAERPVRCLNSVVKSYKNIAVQSAFRPRDPFVLKAVVILAVSSGLAINGLVQFYRIALIKIPFTIDSNAIFLDAIRIGLAVAIALIVISIFVLKRSSRTHLVILELLVIGMFGAISTAYVNLHDANMDFDDSRALLFETKILEKKIRIGRKGRNTYSVITEDWNNEKQEVRINVSSRFYDRVKVGDWLIIKQRIGYLNYRWIEGITKARR